MHTILIINLGGLGDIVLSIPALTALRERYPQARIDFFTARKNAGLIGRWGIIDHEYAVDMGFGGAITLTSALHACKTLWALRQNKYDALVNMRTLYSERGATKIRMICRFIAAKRMYGRNTDGRGSFFDEAIDETKKGSMHESQYDAATVGLLYSGKTGAFSFPVAERARAGADAFCAEHGLRDVPFVLWHIGGMHSRQYPENLVAEAVAEISSRLRVVVTGSAGDRALAQCVRATAPTVVDATGMLGIDVLAALIERAEVVVSNDTGPMHIAAVMQKKLVALFGPGDMTRFDPRFIDHHATVLQGSAPCAPCEHERCSRKECFAGLSPRVVAETVLTLAASHA
jgi:ADP-heptose:LPS heptosyltransferase